MVQRIEMF
ncbi:hypothetical protein ROTMU0001_0782 [Rothia mucilaginosa ATCC 25296]|nr:hypothetical protein ROTMU0001_0782 [Rothia mucilaginosa ATCC 25296]